MFRQSSMVALVVLVVGSLSAVAAAEPKADGKTKSPPKELTVDLGKGVKLEMVLIPAGEFLMGSPDSDTLTIPLKVGMTGLITNPLFAKVVEVQDAKHAILKLTQYSVGGAGPGTEKAAKVLATIPTDGMTDQRTACRRPSSFTGGKDQKYKVTGTIKTPRYGTIFTIEPLDPPAK
jgi:hypothetical protein